MSDVFNHNKFTILNEWIKQWYQYQHSRQSAVTNTLKYIIFTELEDYMHEIYDYEWAVFYWPKVYNFELLETTMIPVSTFLTK